MFSGPKTVQKAVVSELAFSILRDAPALNSRIGNDFHLDIRQRTPRVFKSLIMSVVSNRMSEPLLLPRISPRDKSTFEGRCNMPSLRLILLIGIVFPVFCDDMGALIRFEHDVNTKALHSHKAVFRALFLNWLFNIF